MKLENIPILQQLTTKHTNYKNALESLKNETKAFKNNRELIIFVLQNINFIDDSPDIITHIEFLKKRIIFNIEDTIDDIEKEIKKLD